MTLLTQSAFVLKPAMLRAVACCRQLPLHRAMSTLPHPYKFHIGASWTGKPASHRPGKKTPLDFPVGSDIVVWRDGILKRPKNFASSSAGEDFLYVQEVRRLLIVEDGRPDSQDVFHEMRNQSGVSFGVADGVGGWVDLGVDPSLFSQALMYHAARYSKHSWAGEPEIDPTQDYEEREELEGWEMTPRECLELAHGGVLRERTVAGGSSTACIINLNASSGLLRAANLGDSGFSIIRASAVIHVQPPQTHFFNCPKQLAKLPSSARRYRGACVDLPQEADVFEARLRDGDIVVAYTDGLSDNVFQSEIVNICSLVARSGGSEAKQVQDIADRLVQWACTCMMNRKRVSPFEKAAAKEGMYFRGGKVDDVTAVVAMVQESI